MGHCKVRLLPIMAGGVFLIFREAGDMVDFEKIKKMGQDKNLTVVLAGGFAGIALARDLGRHGVPIIVLGQDKYVTRSRYCYGIYTGDAGCVMDILTALPYHVYKKPLLLTDNERDLTLLYENWPFLEGRYLSLFHPNNRYLSDKVLLTRSAQACGLKVPQVYEDIGDIKAFPVLVKPLNGLAHRNPFIKKAYECHNHDELVQTLDFIRRNHGDALIQEIIPGNTQDLYSVTLYRNVRGAFFIGSVTRKLREYPKTYGTGTSHLTCFRPELVDYSIRLLDAVDYNGVAEIEYKFHEEKQDYYIIEVNGRLPLETGITMKVGNSFLYNIYLDLTAPEDILPNVTKRPETFCAWEREMRTGEKDTAFSAETSQTGLWVFLLKDLLAPGSFPSKIAQYFSYGRRSQIQWALWDKGDLMPLLFYYKHLLGRLVPKPAEWREGIKRAVDILGSLAIIILFMPLMVVIAAMIFLMDPGPVLFKQKRLGRYGKEFTMFKFRSMVVNAEEILNNNASLYHEYVNNCFRLDADRDPRVTPIGRFLRKTSLDELPQCFNVLRGEMSLVGPRPILTKELEYYADQAEDFLSVKPGVTGHWQISGRDDIRYPERVQVEMFYVRNRTMWLDLKILFKTAAAVICRKGAY